MSDLHGVDSSSPLQIKRCAVYSRSSVEKGYYSKDGRNQFDSVSARQTFSFFVVWLIVQLDFVGLAGGSEASPPVVLQPEVGYSLAPRVGELNSYRLIELYLQGHCM